MELKQDIEKDESVERERAEDVGVYPLRKGEERKSG